MIAPLLELGINDYSNAVRERAFCGLTDSATLHLAERYEAVPGLLRIAENPSSDRQTLAWTYQALREITGIHGLPDDAVRWRDQLQDAGLLGDLQIAK